MKQRPLQKAVNIMGGQSALARAIGTRQTCVWYWLNKGKGVPAEYVLPIERATHGTVSRYELRPDIYPSPSNDIYPFPTPALCHGPSTDKS